MPFSKAIKFPIFVYGKTNIHKPKKGLINITPQFLRAGILNIGQPILGYQPKNAVTVFNIKGKMNINGKFTIGKGSAIEVGKEASIVLLNKEDLSVKKIIFKGVEI